MAQHSRALALVFYVKIGQDFRNCKLLSGMNGEDANTLDGDSLMVILLYRNYFARISSCLTFWGTSLQNLLTNLKFLVTACLRLKRRTTHCVPSSVALYGIDVLHVLALWKPVRSNVVTFFMSQYTNFIQFGGESDDHSMRTTHSTLSGSMGATF